MALAPAQAPYPTGTITGKLTAPDGKPVSGVRVRAAGYIGDEQVVLGLTSTSEDGSYRIVGIPPGRWAVLAGPLDSPTYHPGVTAAREATLVTVQENATATGIDFMVAAIDLPPQVGGFLLDRLRPYPCAPTLDWICGESRVFTFSSNPSLPRATGTLTGIVVDQSGLPVSGVTVSLRRPDALTGIEYSTQTNLLGRYTFPRIIPGMYSIRVTIDGQTVVIPVQIDAAEKRLDIRPSVAQR